MWEYIIFHEYKDEMINRLIEELIEMSGWCSSGYISRLVNSICGFGEFNLDIGYSNEIITKFAHKLNKLIQSIKDEELSETLLSEMTEPSGNYLERKVFLKFFRDNVPYIKEDLYEEYKEYISDTDFDLYMIKAISHYEGNERK